jgi:anaerobic magnesium-protoporphyrin IX monomethyl ester cyclase
VVKQHWRIINDLKKLATRNWQLVTLLFGDHVTALPQESFDNSQVDFVLTGGDYDFLLANLCNVLTKSQVIPLRAQASHKSQENLFEPGIWRRDKGQVKNSGPFKLDHDLSTTPIIDRELTHWIDYAYKNGNFRDTPGAYIMSGRDCWWGKCSFCSWPTLYPEYRVRKPAYVIQEIESLVKLGVREMMDDSGSFPVGEWLREFCDLMGASGLNKKVTLDCNMRFGALSHEEYEIMKRAGFRLVLFGLESANQPTLDRVRKNVTVEEIIASCKMARQAGLYPHITIMFGYPWETMTEAAKTLELGRWLLKKGFAYTVQATIVIPYPGTPLFAECQKEGWLKSQDWDDYDMKMPVMRSPVSDAKIKELVQGIYRVAFDPEFIARRIMAIRGVSDLNYFGRGIKKVFGHIFDFDKQKA